MKVLVFSDLHVNKYKRFSDGDSRLDDCLNILKQVYKTANDNKIENILFCGDFFDTQYAINTRVLTKTLEVMQKMSERYPEIYMYGITGNHDLATREGDKYSSAISMFDTINSINFISLDYKAARLGKDVRVIGIPYKNSEIEFSDALDEIVRNEDISDAILLVHQTPKKFHHTGECDEKDSRFDDFIKVFSGHIHDRDNYNYNFTMVGNPLHRDLSDAGVDKGCLIFDTDTKEIDFISFDAFYPSFVKVEQGQEDNYSGRDFVVTVTSNIENERFDEGLSYSDTSNLENLVIQYVENELHRDDSDLVIKIGKECI